MTPEKKGQIGSDLTKIVKGDVYDDIFHLAAFSSDASIYQITPAVVVAPKDAGDVSAVVGYAERNGVPVTARGAASGVAGESLSSGIVLDMCRYMNRIIAYDRQSGVVQCEPGVVLDELNGYLAEFGVKIGPDPSSGNRAVVGGCVANNATGAHSLEYGYMADYLQSVEAVVADGAIVEFGNDVDPAAGEDQKVSDLAKKCYELLSDKGDVIEKALPRSKRNRSGYNIAGICHGGKIDMARLLAGSEGTLCVFTKIRLRTVPVPPVKGLLQVEFDSLQRMAEAVPLIVDSGASACELMDKRLAEMAVEAYPGYKDVMATEALVSLVVEHTGQSEQDVKAKIENTKSMISEFAGGMKVVFDADKQKMIWKSRKDAVPLLSRKKGSSHPIPFIEDASVDNGRLAEYIEALEAIGKKYNFQMSYYGHAGDGELHIRPYIDLSGPEGIEKMRAVANDVFELVWSLGGSISGEHADGLVRAGFIKMQYGAQFYELLRGIKRIFDPGNILNPGKIINDDPDVMIKNLRASHGFLAERLESELFFNEDELRFEIEQCSGCGVCLSRSADMRMCPVYRALGEELGSSRAKANILRFWATGQMPDSDFESDEFKKFIGLCVNCKACSVQCPSGVDISKIVTAARARYAKAKGVGLTKKILSRNRYLAILAGAFAPIANFVMGLPIFKWFLDKAAGLDKRRTMPGYEFGAFVKTGRKYLAALERKTDAVDKVAYFVDTYANYNDHQLAFDVLKVLIYNDIDVVIPDQVPAPLPSVVYGDVKPAKKELAYNVKHLADAVRDGRKIICSEPSAALCLKEELRYFVDTDDARLVSENTYELMTYLWRLNERGKLKKPTNQLSGEFAYHNPCHLLACGYDGGSVQLLNKVCGLDIKELNAGCCGLAGTFGMQKENYDLSTKIGERLKEAIKTSGIKEILTECGACKMQIEHLASVKVSHPIKILAKAYGG